MKMGAKLKKLRKEKGLTQEQLAEALYISPQAVSKWETDQSSPDVDMLPRLAVLYCCSMDELFDFDVKRTEREVEALVRESVPLRADPAEAERFYREALEKYPDNETLLNCLLIVIPDDRSREKLEIGERLLAETKDPEIRYDVLRLLALCCRNLGEQGMAEHYLSRIPELYFTKTELDAAILKDGEQLEAIRKAEEMSLGTLKAMLILHGEAAGDAGKRALAERLLELFQSDAAFSDVCERLKKKLDDGTILDFYR